MFKLKHGIETDMGTKIKSNLPLFVNTCRRALAKFKYKFDNKQFLFIALCF